MHSSYSKILLDKLVLISVASYRKPSLITILPPPSNAFFELSFTLSVLFGGPEHTVPYAVGLHLYMSSYLLDQEYLKTGFLPNYLHNPASGITWHECIP